MSSLKYNGTKITPTPKKAYLFLQGGLEQAGDTDRMRFPGVTGLGLSIIDEQERKYFPSNHYFTYGKAQQAEFIASFQKILNDNHIFKNTEIITNPEKPKTNDVLITVKFKSTRVNCSSSICDIILIVEMTIKSQHSTFTRTYLTENDDKKIYRDQVVDVSQKMADQLMNGINQWSHSH